MKNKFLLILLVAIVVIFIGVLAYLARTGKLRPSAEVTGPSLTLAPGSQTVEVGQTFNVRIVVNTDGQEIDGVDVLHLHYEPAKLEVQDADSSAAGVQIQKGSIFPSWPANTVNTTTGEISISGIVNVGADVPGYSGYDTFATITFKALQPVITTTLHFDFTPGLTTDCNMAQHAGTGVDILSAAPDGYYTVTSERGVTPTPTPTPTATPTATPTTTPTPTERATTNPTDSPTNGPTEEPTSVSWWTPEPTSPNTNFPTDLPSSIAFVTPTSGVIGPSSGFDFTPSPTESTPSGPVKVAGKEISRTILVLIIIGLAIVLTLVGFYVWRWRKGKKGLGVSDSDSGDDDEI